MKINQEKYDRIAAEIHSDSSPVGIDAKKTHILILQLLTDIDDRLKRVEAGMNSLNGTTDQASQTGSQP